MPPGKDMDNWLTILRSGLWRLYYKLSVEGRKRFFSEFMPLLHDTKHDILGERDDHSYYLVYLGSRPSSRGKGYAKKLVQHMTKQVRTSLLSVSLFLRILTLLKMKYIADVNASIGGC
jgi:GNAT superfamily N-acetyltransferase